MNNSKTRKLGHGMQQLEDRRLMAGDVTVAFNNGDLNIIGDNLDNRIDITTVNGQIRVSGNNWNGATTINGQSAPFLINESLIDDLRIDTNGGHDRVFINQVHLNNTPHADLVIDTDGGNDLVGIYNSSAVNLDLDTHDGNDQVIVSYSAFVDDLKVELGSGDDELDLYAAYANFIKLEGEAGRDDIAVQYSQAVDDLLVKLGDGNDILWINGGNYEDVAVYGDSGADRITLQQVQIADDLFADMGGGDDQLHLYNNNVYGSKYFHGGIGADKLYASGNNFNALSYDYSF